MAQVDEIFFLVSRFAFAATALLALNRIEVLISKRQPQTKRYDNPLDIRALIGAKEHSEWGQNKLEGLEARSLSNEHLRRIFGIENAFTTVDKKYANEFVRRSKHLINVSAIDWRTIGEDSEVAVWNWKNEARSGKDSNFRVELQPLIQSFTLFAILNTFFFLDSEAGLQDVPINAFTRLSKTINETWMMSKSGDPIVDFKDNEVLRDALKDLLPLADLSDPRENPLNIILPGFETMWRVVLRGFIEVAYKTGKKHRTWRTALIVNFQDPKTENFHKIYTRDGVSASHLVKETLRLYPPTKRVYREWQSGKIRTTDDTCCRHTSVSSLDKHLGSNS